MGKRGFTLIELLSVVIILGIITAIAVPVYITLQDKGNKNNYKYYEKVVTNAAKLYIEPYIDSLNHDKNCFSFDYSELITSKKISEETYICSGYITATRISGINFRIDQYLNCKDDKNKEIVSKKTSAPLGACPLK